MNTKNKALIGGFWVKVTPIKKDFKNYKKLGLKGYKCGHYQNN